jgi:hypothetical protein
LKLHLVPKFAALVKMFCLLAFLLVPGQVALAHEVRPAIVDLDIKNDGAINIWIRLNLEAVIADIGSGHNDTSQSKNADRYDQLRALPPEALAAAFDKTKTDFIKMVKLAAGGNSLVLKMDVVRVAPVGNLSLSRLSGLGLSGQIPKGAKYMTWQWPEKYGNAVVRVKGKPVGKNSDKMVFAGMVKGGAMSKPIALEGLVVPDGLEVFVQYIEIGIEHIIPKGLDHILFVVGLFLLSARLSSLLWQISSFTIAHTLTLGLAMAGIISAPASFVEPLIALSIVFVAVENLMTGTLHRWRPVVVFMFGLLHGLGFASVLNDIGLAPTSFFVGLIGFNLGVEFGQLTVIAICFLLVGFWFSKKPWYRQRITNPASLLIAIIGAWWFVERMYL